MHSAYAQTTISSLTKISAVLELRHLEALLPGLLARALLCEEQLLQPLLLAKVAKPPSWTPDRLVNNCQQCKLPFNRADPNMARKHHCRHCGRCVCSLCSARRLPIPKFGSTQDERVCLLCERVLTTASAAEVIASCLPASSSGRGDQCRAMS